MKIIKILLIIAVLGSFINCSNEDDLGIIGTFIKIRIEGTQKNYGGTVIEYKKNKFMKLRYSPSRDYHYTYTYINLEKAIAYNIYPSTEKHKINKEKKK